MTDAVLAIDAGTTGVTALVVDASGRIVAQGTQEFAQHFPADGWVEHDLGEIWQATLASVRAARSAFTGRIVAVGITNQRETVAFWDRETLGAPRRAIVWQDRRTADHCRALRDAGHEPLVRQVTGLRLDPYFSATKIAWVREHDPATWAQVEAGRVAIGTIDSYLVARMSRGLDHVTDATNASRTLLYDLRTGRYDDTLCALFGVPVQALPEIVSSTGRLSHTDPAAFDGLDVPVTGIAGDQQAALFGQTAFSAGDAKCTYGTGSFLLSHTGDTPVWHDGLLTTVALQAADGTRTFAVEGSVFVTGAAVQWLRDGLGVIDTAGDIEALAGSVADAGGVVFVPALTGLGAPDWDPQARGLIIGITRATTAAHLARATLDAIAFQVADVAQLMAQAAPLTRLAVDGGAAANNLLCQLQADTLGIPVDRARQVQSTGLGAAYLAGLGIGMWTSGEELHALRESSAVFTPHQDRQRDRARWRAAVERSKGWASVVEVSE